MDAKSRRGEVKHFTGISAPYEEPERPEVTVETDRMSLEDEVAEVMRFLRSRSLVPEAAATRG